MKTFQLTYNGETSKFNGVYDGYSQTISNGIVTSYSRQYKVRPSKTNKLGITRLFECHDEQGNVTYHFNSAIRVERGHHVEVIEL